MHPYLTRLGVPPEVQRFFQPFYHADPQGNLVFPYGNDTESFGFAFHRIPDTEMLWIAGNTNYQMVRKVFICASALEAIAYLTTKLPTFNSLDNLIFLSAGVRPNTDQIRWVGRNLSGKLFKLVFGKDILGRVCDLKMAAGISNMPVAIFISDDNVHVNFRFKNHVFAIQDFSLNAFERKTGHRFNIPAQKPLVYDSYLEQLKANNFNSY
jgi:hypothetical protein